MDFINPELSCRVFDSHNKKKKQHDYHAFERSLEVGTTVFCDNFSRGDRAASVHHPEILAIVLCDKTL